MTNPDVGIFSHSFSRVDFDGTTATNDDDLSILCNHAQVLLQVDVRQHLEDEIRSLAVSQLCWSNDC